MSNQMVTFESLTRELFKALKERLVIATPETQPDGHVQAPEQKG